MNPFALLSLLSCAVVFILGSFIFLRDTRKPLNRIFMALCASLAFWSFTEFGYRQADSFETAYFWLKLSNLSFIVAPVLLHFVLVFTEESKLFKTRLTYVFMYSPALIIILVSLTTNMIGGEPVEEYWGWIYTIPEDSLIYSISYAWAYGMGILSIYLCLLYYLRESDYKKKQQAKYIFFGFLIVLATGLITEWLLPIMQIRIPESATTAFTVACACAGYAMWKYKLFAITPATAAEGIISTMPDSLILVDPEQRIILTNQATLKMLGYEESELIGQTLGIVFTEKDKGKNLPEGIEAEGSTETSIVRGETRFKTKFGGSIPILLSKAVMKDRDGKTQGTIYIGRDVTELKLAEEEKQRMEERLHMAGRLAAVGELSAGVAHELNNPLAAIQAFAQFLASRRDLDETVKGDVETIYREAQRASRITGNLLSFARRNDPQKRLISIDEVLERSVELHAYRMKASNIEIVMELARNLPLTMADAHQMQQVFVNIIRNAEQAMTEAHGGGRLCVKTQRTEEVIQITITDNGPGIPEHYMQSIFDPFFTTKEVGKGTGLGLSICYGIVEGHGGHIYARSNAGEGATFVVEIPIATDKDCTVDRTVSGQTATDAAIG
jgi:PAS domain S-box-containing protein